MPVLAWEWVCAFLKRCRLTRVLARVLASKKYTMESITPILLSSKPWYSYSQQWWCRKYNNMAAQTFVNQCRHPSLQTHYIPGSLTYIVMPHNIADVAECDQPHQQYHGILPSQFKHNKSFRWGCYNNFIRSAWTSKLNRAKQTNNCYVQFTWSIMPELSVESEK